ncbi:MAG: DUF362 domain-containing protein [Chlamydiota bacterium]
MASKVFFTDLRAKAGNSLLAKTARLFDLVGFGDLLRKGDKVAVKLHWGEWGNVAFLPPPFARCLVDKVLSAGGKPFLTDTNTLYSGGRRNAIDHVLTALKNGFSVASAGAPIIIADGLTGGDSVEVAAKGKHVSRVRVAGAIYHADAVLSLAHFKGHELFGFGGALKNIAMGCTTPAGKQFLHSDVKPRVDQGLCVACGTCIRSCAAGAISAGGEGKAKIDARTCVGCGECVAACPAGAIPINWKTASEPLMEKSAEYAKAILANKCGRAAFFNFLMRMSPDCDCYDWNDAPFVADIGILASRDPVAVDQASADLVNSGQVLATSRLKGAAPGGDAIAAATGVKGWRRILHYAEEIGLGSREYELVKTDREAS